MPPAPKGKKSGKAGVAEAPSPGPGAMRVGAPGASQADADWGDLLCQVGLTPNSFFSTGVQQEGLESLINRLRSRDSSQQQELSVLRERLQDLEKLAEDRGEALRQAEAGFAQAQDKLRVQEDATASKIQAAVLAAEEAGFNLAKDKIRSLEAECTERVRAAEEALGRSQEQIRSMDETTTVRVRSAEEAGFNLAQEQMRERSAEHQRAMAQQEARAAQLEEELRAVRAQQEGRVAQLEEELRAARAQVAAVESAQRAKLDQTVLGMETKMNALSLEVTTRADAERAAVADSQRAAAAKDALETELAAERRAAASRAQRLADEVAETRRGFDTEMAAAARVEAELREARLATTRLEEQKREETKLRGSQDATLQGDITALRATVRQLESGGDEKNAQLAGKDKEVAELRRQLEEALAAKQEATTLAVVSQAERDEALGKVEQTRVDTDFVIRGLEDKCRQADDIRRKLLERTRLESLDSDESPPRMAPADEITLESRAPSRDVTGSDVQRGRAHERSKGLDGSTRRDLSVKSEAVSADRAAGGGADRLSEAHILTRTLETIHPEPSPRTLELLGEYKDEEWVKAPTGLGSWAHIPRESPHASPRAASPAPVLRAASPPPCAPASLGSASLAASMRTVFTAPLRAASPAPLRSPSPPPMRMSSMTMTQRPSPPASPMVGSAIPMLSSVPAVTRVRAPSPTPAWDVLATVRSAGYPGTATLRAPSPTASPLMSPTASFRAVRSPSPARMRSRSPSARISSPGRAAFSGVLDAGREGLGSFRVHHSGVKRLDFR